MYFVFIAYVIVYYYYLPCVIMVYYILSGLLMFFWCPCMAINVSVYCSADHERDWPPCKVVFFRVGNQCAECEKQQQQQQYNGGLVCIFIKKTR